MSTGSGLNFSTTPAMGLFLPTPGQCGALGIEPSGKSWMELQNASLALVDSHTHAPGFGTQVPTAGLNINADLSFNGLNALGLRTARFSPLANVGTLSVADVGCLAVVGADLYYIDAAANQVRITQSGAIAGAPGSITGLVAPASISYTPASKLFTFLSSAPRLASMAFGPTSIGDATVDNGNRVTISAPAALAGNYALTLPTALPGSDGLLRLATTGALSSFGILAGANLTLPGTLVLGGALTVAGAISGVTDPTIGSQQAATAHYVDTETYAVLGFGADSVTNGNAACFLPMGSGAGFGSSTANSANIGMVMPAAGVLRNARFRFRTGASSTNTTIDILKNGVVAATFNVTSTAPADPATGSLAGVLATVAAGDFIQVRINNSGNPFSVGPVYVSMQWSVN